MGNSLFCSIARAVKLPRASESRFYCNLHTTRWALGHVTLNRVHGVSSQYQASVCVEHKRAVRSLCDVELVVCNDYVASASL